MSRSVYSIGDVVAGEGCTFLIPRDYKPGVERPVVYVHQLGGTALTGSDAVGAPGFYNLINKVARRFLVIVTDMAGTGNWGTDPARDQIPLCKDQAVARFGALDGPLRILMSSMGGLATMRYLVTPGAVAGATVCSAIGGIGLGDLRDFNRSNTGGGWVGGVAQPPANANGVNAAWGLPANSTGDYPVHGSSLAPLPAGADPATLSAQIAAKQVHHFAQYANDDVTTIPSIMLAHIAAIGNGSIARDMGAWGHTDTAVGKANTDDIIDYYLAH